MIVMGNWDRRWGGSKELVKKTMSRSEWDEMIDSRQGGKLRMKTKKKMMMMMMMMMMIAMTRRRRITGRRTTRIMTMTVTKRKKMRR